VGWTVSDDSRVVRSHDKIVGDREDDGHDDTWVDIVDDVVLHTYDNGAILMANGKIVVKVPNEVTTEYGVFNDEDTWNALFASGEVHESLRETLLERPLYAAETLREAAQHARLANEERGVQNRIDKFGFVVVKTRTVTRSPWVDVPRDEQAQELGEF
jgi:hypothetical protein